jgi:Gnt-I system low-affinity gluconate transporter
MDASSVLLAPVVLAVLGVALLLALLVVARWHAFLALLATSLVVALASGTPPQRIAAEIQQHMGSTLGFIAVVVGLGAMFGELLQRSGGAAAIAQRLLQAAGERRAPWALALTGVIVATPVFFDVALIVLVPLVYSLARSTGRSLLHYAVPLVAGLAVAHAFVPPTPGPVAVAGLLGADLGWVIALGFVAGLPATLVGGLWYGRLVARRIHLEAPPASSLDAGPALPSPGVRTAGFSTAVGLVALPLGLILLGTVSAVALPEESRVRGVLALAGHPFTALLVTAILAFDLLGTRLGFSAAEVREMATRSLEPVGAILLVTGAGGVFGKVLLATGAGQEAADWMTAAGLPLVVMAFLVAAAVRIAQGSATVSMVTAGGLMAPIVEAVDLSAPRTAALVIAISSGATVLSHFNDSGFWLVSRYLGMNESQTLRVWTVVVTLVGVTGLAVVAALWPWL